MLCTNNGTANWNWIWILLIICFIFCGGSFGCSGGGQGGGCCNPCTPVNGGCASSCC